MVPASEIQFNGSRADRTMHHLVFYQHCSGKNMKVCHLAVVSKSVNQPFMMRTQPSRTPLARRQSWRRRDVRSTTEDPTPRDGLEVVNIRARRVWVEGEMKFQKG